MYCHSFGTLNLYCSLEQTTTLHVHHVILNIYLPSLHHYIFYMKLHNFMSLHYGVGEHNTKIVTFFF